MVDKKISQLDEKVSPVDADTVGIVDSVTGGNKRTTVGALRGTSFRSGEVIWEWNGVDLSEFDQVAEAACVASVTTWHGRFGFERDESPCIQINNPGSDSGKLFALLLKPAVFDLTLYPKLLLEVRVANRTSLSTQDPLLIPYYEDTSHLHAIARKSGGYQWTVRNGSVGWADTDWLIGLNNAEQSSDGGDSMWLQFELSFAPAPLARVRKPFAGDAAGSQRVTQALRTDEYHASWAGLAPAPRIGIGLRCYGTAASPGNVFADLRIRRAF